MLYYGGFWAKNEIKLGSIALFVKIKTIVFIFFLQFIAISGGCNTSYTKIIFQGQLRKKALCCNKTPFPSVWERSYSLCRAPGTRHCSI